MDGVDMRVVDGAGHILDDRVVGSVEIRSRTMTTGYYRSPTADAGLLAPDGWLRTGDAGFLDGGRLVLTGRIKEIIIQAGQNYDPHDIERVAEEVDGIDLGKVVACGIVGAAEQPELLVMFVHSRVPLQDFPTLALTLREHLLRRGGWLVDHVLPVTSVQKTTSGKIERYRLAQRFLDGDFDAVIDQLADLGDQGTAEDDWRRATGRDRSRLLLARLRAGAEQVIDTVGLALDRSLFDQGLDSRRAVALQRWLDATFDVDLPVSLAFDNPTLLDIANVIDGFDTVGRAPDDTGRTPEPSPAHPGAGPHRDEPIAIIGIGCRFPGGAYRPASFWRLLMAETDTTGALPGGRGQPPEPVTGSFLSDVAGFDHKFFSMSVREAEALDPQARLLLEVCWEALEDGGQDIPALAGQEVGVYVGIANTDYAMAQFHSGDGDKIGPYSYTGVAPSLAVGRVSHALGFQGPAMALDTACSSSLLAVHQAVESLRSGDCAMALAGGVNLILGPAGHQSLTHLGALSPTGACRPFDDRADGYVRG